MSCNIFNSNFLDQINFNELNSNQLDLSGIRILMSGYNDSISGIWQPIVMSGSNIKFVDPLIQVNTSFNKQFEPCNCNNSQLISLNKNFYNNNQEQDLNAPYCCGAGDPFIEDGKVFIKSCDIKLHNDDFLPKVPVLNQSYVSGFYDFKHLKEFPACNNPALGFERILFVENFNNHNLDFCIDWKIKETISEIPYDKITSYHVNEYTHNKSYEKSQMVSSTCGNFILLSIDPTHQTYLTNYPIFNSLNSSKIIPEIEDFTKPYGFDNQTYNNIFIDRKKMASYWKWNYTSGVLCWYRHYDISRKDDKRPIPGVDLYISPGDVFYATNNGPEPSTSGIDISFGQYGSPARPPTPCASGLKIVDGQSIIGIIPSGSQFIYISQNIYKRFFNLYTTYTELGFDHNKSLSLSALMCTAPLYDKFTTDLLSKEGRNNYTNFNASEQIDILNKYMVQGTTYRSVDDLYYIYDKESLVRTLYAKYGGYLWIPPNTSGDISLNAGSSNSLYVDLDFDMCINSEQIKFANINSSKFNFCETDPLSNISKKFAYDQSFTFGDLNIGARLDPRLRYSDVCNNSDVTYSVYGTLFYNNDPFKSFPVFNGVSSFRNRYRNIITRINPPSDIVDLLPPEDVIVHGDKVTMKITRDDMRRNYKALAFNPHLDLLAFHPDGGIYFNANSFGEINNVVFNRNVPVLRIGGNIIINFRTDDVGIKIYKINIKKLQSNVRGTEKCERFPIDGSNKKCKCYGLNLSQYNNHPLVCNESRTNYTTSPFYLPNLSTKYSPAIRASGGIGSVLPIVTNKLNPDNPYSCDQSAEIALSNYTTISYGLTLKNFNTNHSDIVVTAYENMTIGDIFNPDLPQPPPKRVVNEIKINDSLTLYADQEKILYRSNELIRDNTQITLTNSFLTSVIDNNTISLGFLCFDTSFDDSTFYERKRNDEISTTILKFRQKPRKQILSFKVTNNPVLQNPKCCPWWSNIVNQARLGNERQAAYILSFSGKTLAEPGPCPIDSLIACEKDLVVGGPFISIKKGSYSSISGVSYTTGVSNSSPLLNTGEIDYNSRMDQKILILEIPFGLDYYIERILNQVVSFDKHRKLKLYISTDSGSTWFSSKIPSRGGYVLSDTTYIGNPRFFDYIRNPLISVKKPFFVPAPPKKQISLDYLLHTQPNLQPFNVPAGVLLGGIDYFPKTIANLWNNITDYKHWPVKGRFWDPIFTSDSRVVRFKGIRPYFRIPETRNSRNFPDIESLEELILTSPSFEQGDLIRLQNPGYYVYIGPTINDVKNYVFIGNNPNILKKYSNLDIDLKNYSDTGYVFDTYTVCDIEVDLFQVSNTAGPFLLPRDRNNRPLFRRVGSNVIVGKRIILKFFNKDGAEISSSSNENIYIKIYTEFIFRDQINQEFNLIWFNRSSIVIYDKDTLSTDRDILLANKKYNTKWGDLIKYDNILLNNEHLPSYNQFPNTAYNNLFYKQIINDQKDDFTFTIIGSNPFTPIVLEEYTGDNRPYFCIYQKYNLDDESVWSIDTDSYDNYLPFMEINMSTQIPDILSSGNFQSSVLYNIYNLNEFDKILPYPNPDNPTYPYTQYCIFNPIDNFEAAFVPDDNVQYLPSLRIDNPLFVLHKTIRENKVTSRNDAREIFTPNLNNLQTFDNTAFNISSNFNRTLINRRTSFISRLAYADIDKPKQGENSISSCGSEVCRISTAGSIDLKAQYAVYEPKSITYDQLPSGSMIGFIGYDGGLYNIIGDRQVSIVRTESFVDEQRSIDSPAETNITCSTFKPIPSNTSNIFSSEYQEYIRIQETNNPITHSDNVVAMDRHANEMLFRILYGESAQKINKKQLFIDNKILTSNDLVNYVEPIVTPSLLYDQILYNYDKNTIQDIAVTGNITINGTKKIGDSINITINNQNISLSIVNISNNIVLIGSIGSERINEIIYRNSVIENRLLSVEYTDDQDPGEIGSPDGNTSMTLLASRTIETKYVTSSWDVRLKEGYCPLDKPPLNPGPECYGTEQVTGPDGETVEVPIILDLPGCKEDCIRIGNDIGVGSSFPGGSFSFDFVPISLRGCEPSKPYDPFIYDYCRAADTSNVDESNPISCSNCENYVGVEGRLEFDYSFQKCSTLFNLKGHAYRVKIGPKIPVPPPPRLPGPPPLSTTATCQGNISVDGLVWGCILPTFTAFGGDKCLDSSRNCCIPTWGNPWNCTKSSPVTSTSSVTRKVYKMSTLVSNPPYTPSTCAQSFLNISYTNDKIIVKLINPNKTYCLPINNRGCPNIDINIPSDYTISDDVDGSCESDCKKIEIELLPQNNSFDFELKDYTVVQDFGSYSYGDIQDGDIIVTNGSWGVHCTDVPAWCPPTCVGSWASLCGGGQPWYSRMGGYQGYGSQDSYNSWRINTQIAYDNMAMSPARVSPAIPIEDIIEGIIPGTMSLNFKTYTFDIPKARQVSRDEVEYSTYPFILTIAYITYTYRKATTINDYLLSLTGYDPTSIMEEERDASPLGVAGSTVNLFNLKYNHPRSAGGLSRGGLPLPLKMCGSRVGGSYKQLQPIYKKDSCDNAPTCYNNETYDRNQTLCNYEDWMCWSYWSGPDARWRACILNRRLPPSSNEMWVY